MADKRSTAKETEAHVVKVPTNVLADKKVEVKGAAKAEEKKTAAPKAEEKKAEAKKAPAKKAATKSTTAKKTATKKVEVKESLTIQFSDKSYAKEDLIKIAKDVWKFDLKKKVSELKEIELFVKTEENTVYYVFNGDILGSFSI